MALTVQGWPRVVSSAAPAETATARMGPFRDRTTLAVGLVAAVLSTASTYYYFRRHLILGYQDSFSHLEISLRVVAGLSPGIAQLGGIWLPYRSYSKTCSAGTMRSTGRAWPVRPYRWCATWHRPCC